MSSAPPAPPKSKVRSMACPRSRVTPHDKKKSETLASRMYHTFQRFSNPIMRLPSMKLIPASACVPKKRAISSCRFNVPAKNRRKFPWPAEGETWGERKRRQQKSLKKGRKSCVHSPGHVKGTCSDRHPPEHRGTNTQTQTRDLHRWCSWCAYIPAS